MIKQKTIRLIAVIALAVGLCFGLGLLALGNSSSTIENPSETSLHYELPKLLPTTWIGRR